MITDTLPPLQRRKRHSLSIPANAAIHTRSRASALTRYCFLQCTYRLLSPISSVCIFLLRSRVRRMK